MKMVYDNEILSCFHDGASAGMAVAILGPLRSLHQLTHTNIPLAGPRHDASLQTEMKRLMIDREVPTRELDSLRMYSKNIDVRYFKNLQRLKDRLKSNYSCSPHYCPMIKERLEQHQVQCRRAAPNGGQIPCNTATSPGLSTHRLSTESSSKIVKIISSDFTSTENSDRRISANLNVIHTDTSQSTSTGKIEAKATEKPSTSKEPSFVSINKAETVGTNGNRTSSAYCKPGDGRASVKSKSPTISHSHYSGSPDKNITRKIPCPNDNSSNDQLRTHNTKNRTVTTSQNSKSDSKISQRSSRLQELTRTSIKDIFKKEIEEWLRDVPIYSNLGQEAKEECAVEIDNLIRNLNELSTETANTEQEQNIRNEIERCLKNLPVWYPGSKRDLDTIKNNLVDSLMTRIKRVFARRSSNNNKCSSISRNSFNVSNVDSKISINYGVRDVIIEWLWSINLKTKNNNGMANNMSKISEFVVNRIKPSLDKHITTKKQKLILTTTIINVLNDLPIHINCPRYRNLHIQKFAEDLVERLLFFQVTSVTCTKDEFVEVSPDLCNKRCGIPSSDIIFKDTKIFQEASKCFQDNSLKCPNAIIRETEIILEEFMDAPSVDGECIAKNEIAQLLLASTNVSEAQASNVAKRLIKRIKNILGEGTNSCMSQTYAIPQLTRNISVYTSEDNCSRLNYPQTSTPKKKSPPKKFSKMSPQEKEYMDKIAKLIRAWMDTLPKNFCTPDEREFKETIIQDLAGDIMDDHKVAQLSPNPKEDRQKYIKYILYRWIHRLEELDIHQVIPQIDQFLLKLKDIPVPILTYPQHGNRQAMANIRHMEGELGWKEEFIPKASDILEDEISMWMNQQQSDIFHNKGQCHRHNKIHELAQTLESKLTTKRPPTEISGTVLQWLNSIVKDQEKHEIVYLAEDLKDRVIGLPHDSTLAANYGSQKEESELNESTPQTINERRDTDEVEQENTIKVFIDKFIKHNYDIDDPMARSAANQLLMSHLRQLSPSARAMAYDNIGNNERGTFPSQQVMRELEYIKYVSDWLKNIPMEPAYNTLGNRERVDFVTNLAANIRDVEEQRESDPDAMDYNLYMASIISQFMEQLPILKDHIDSKNVTFMIDQLLSKIIDNRQAVLNKTETNVSMDSTGINTDNIGDFIEEFIRIHGDDLADNELKLEVWALRLIREIKRMMAEAQDPSAVTKGQCYNCMKDVPLPGDETANVFGLELEYIEAICNWMKNLPLLSTTQTEDDNRSRKICELAEKITEMNNKKATNPNDSRIETEFNGYLTQWISELPLDNTQNIIFPVVIEQLLNRIENVKHKEAAPIQYSSQVTSKTAVKSPIRPKKSKTSVKSTKSGSKSSGKLIIDIIEKWSQSLPIKADNDRATKIMKDNISLKLFQKVGELNMDPKVFNNDLLYQDMLVDEIDTILENVPQNCQLQSNRENLKIDIVNSIIETKNMIKDKTAGDAYKLKLENTILISMPDPMKTHQVYDPGFEIYKHRLATMFILENFDHSVDEVKIKYEKNVKKEIDKYFECAQKKNTLQLTNDQMYNELYSALYKVPIPNEASIIEEVEELKTRCEVDVWFDELPMKEADGVIQCLEWDNILSTLAKRIHEIEKEPKPDQKINKEILKWLSKLPLLPGYENNLQVFAEKLQNKLKNTATQRKCVLSSKNSKSKKDKSKAKVKEMPKAQEEEGQITGPSCLSMKKQSISHLQDKSGPPAPKKNAGDIVLEIVQTWCNDLPICLDHNSTHSAKDNLVTKIMIKISELNMDPAIFNVDALYDKLLDDELELLFSDIQTCTSFQKIKEAKKRQLREGIKSVKPLIREENAHHKYKEVLSTTIDKVLKKPKNMTAEKEALFLDLKNDIIDDFVQYKFGNDDHEQKQKYKMKVEEEICKFIADVAENKGKDKNKDSLIKTNQLLCELAKIPTNEIIFNDDIVEIQMKREVTDFFNELSFNKTIEKSKVNRLKASLAKKLNDIEMGGYGVENEKKMKQEILKCLRKLDKEVSPQIVDAFLSKLKATEAMRRPRTTQLKRNVIDNNKCQEKCDYNKVNSRAQQNTLLSSMSSTSNVNCKFPKTKNNITTTDDIEVHTITDMNGSRNECKATQAQTYVSEHQRCCVEPAEDNVIEKSKSCSEKIQTDKCDLRRGMRCHCLKRPTSVRSRPCCFFPMKWYCDGYDSYNPFWCRMPLPGFF